jgi:hypothetical protein
MPFFGASFRSTGVAPANLWREGCCPDSNAVVSQWTVHETYGLMQCKRRRFSTDAAGLRLLLFSCEGRPPREPEWQAPHVDEPLPAAANETESFCSHLTW